MNLIDGKNISKNILKNIEENIKKAGAVQPGLAVVLIGNDDASHIYVNLKEEASQKIGMNFFKFLFDESVSDIEILKKIEELNKDEKVHGIIVQLPLPKKFDTQSIIDAIDPKKDVDGFHPTNVNLFFQGKGNVTPVFPGAIIKMIDSALENRKPFLLDAIVIANSSRFGDVMTAALSQKGFNTKYVFCEDVLKEKPDGTLIESLREADVIVTACGIPGLLEKGMTKNGAIIIDGGIKKENKKVLGDVDTESFKNTNCHISPVPGGVGPVTVACLLENTYLMSLR